MDDDQFVKMNSHNTIQEVDSKSGSSSEHSAEKVKIQLAALMHTEDETVDKT